MMLGDTYAERIERRWGRKMSGRLSSYFIVFTYEITKNKETIFQGESTIFKIVFLDTQPFFNI